jgi:hypothetical protein
MEEQDQTLLEFFKTLANAERLQIIGMLSMAAADAAQIAERLRLPPYTVLRHLERLEAINLIQAQGDDPIAARHGNQRYRLNTQGLNELSQRVLAGEQRKPDLQDFDGEAYERKVLSDFMTTDGRLKALPVQEKKLLVVLRYLTRAFQPGERYTEKQVNEILGHYHIDTAALRRYLVDYRLLERSAGLYWRL